MPSQQQAPHPFAVRVYALVKGWPSPLRRILRWWIGLVVFLALTYVTANLPLIWQVNFQAYITSLFTFGAIRNLVVMHPIYTSLGAIVVVALSVLGWSVDVVERHQDRLQDKNDSAQEAARRAKDLLDPQYDDAPDRKKYLEAVQEMYGKIDVFLGGDAQRISLEDLFQPLRVRKQLAIASEAKAAPDLTRLQALFRRLWEIVPHTNSTVDARETLLDGDAHCVVITGVQGSGKTTLLKDLITRQAQKALPDANGVVPNPNAAMPIYISLTDMAQNLRGRPLSQYIHDTILHLNDNPRFADHAWGAVKEGKTFICLDGLNEIPQSETRRHIINLINDNARQYKGTWIVATRRIAADEGHFARTLFSEWEIAPMDRFIQLQFAQRLLPQLAKTLDAQFDPAPTQFVNLLESEETRQDWAKNPLLFTLAATFYIQRQQLPDSRAELYAAAVDTLLGRNYQDNLKHTQIKQVAGAFALILFERRQTVFSDEDVLELLVQIRQHTGEDWKDVEMGDELIHHSGIIDSVSKNTYMFRHQSFQEYLVAYALARQFVNRNRSESEMARNLALNKQQYNRWRSVIQLTLSILTQEYTNRNGPSIALKWLETLAEQRGSDYGDLGLILSIESFCTLETIPTFRQNVGPSELPVHIILRWIDELHISARQRREPRLRRLWPLVETICQIPAFTDPLIFERVSSYASDGDEDVRATAMTLLWLMGLRGYHVPARVALTGLEDSDANVRQMAVLLAGTIADHADLLAPIRRLVQRDQVDTVRVACIWTLVRWKEVTPQDIGNLLGQFLTNLSGASSDGAAAGPEKNAAGMDDADGAAANAQQKPWLTNIIRDLRKSFDDARDVEVGAVGSIIKDVERGGIVKDVEPGIVSEPQSNDAVMPEAMPATIKKSAAAVVDAPPPAEMPLLPEPVAASTRRLLQATTEQQKLVLDTFMLLEKRWQSIATAFDHDDLEETLARLTDRTLLRILTMWYVILTEVLDHEPSVGTLAQSMSFRDLNIENASWPVQGLDLLSRVRSKGFNVQAYLDRSPNWIVIQVVQFRRGMGEYIISIFTSQTKNGQQSSRSPEEQEEIAKVRQRLADEQDIFSAFLTRQRDLPEDLDALRKLLRDEDPAVRGDGIYRLIRRGDDEARQLLHAVVDSDANVQNQLLAAIGLLHHGDMYGRRVILRHIDDADADTASIAIVGSGMLKNKTPVWRLFRNIYRAWRGGDWTDNITLASGVALLYSDRRSLPAAIVRMGIRRRLARDVRDETNDDFARSLEALGLGVMGGPLARRRLHWLIRQRPQPTADGTPDVEASTGLYLRIAATIGLILATDASSAKTLHKLLHHRDQQVREIAVMTLGLLSLIAPDLAHYPLERLETWSHDQDVYIRRTAHQTLRQLAKWYQMEPRAGVNLLNEALRDDDIVVSTLASIALFLLGERAPIEIVERAMKMANPDYRAFAALGLGSLGAMSALLDIMPMDKVKDGEKRKNLWQRRFFAMLHALHDQMENTHLLRPEGVATFSRAFDDAAHDPSEVVRFITTLFYGFYAAFESDVPLAPFTDMLANDDFPGVRGADAIALTLLYLQRDTIKDYGPLIAMTKDGEEAVRIIASLGLAILAATGADVPLEPLSELAHSEHSALQIIAILMLGGLGTFGRPVSSDALQTLVDDESAAVRMAVAAALGSIEARRETGGMPALMQLAEDDDPVVRFVATLALGVSARSSAIPALQNALTDEEWYVRAAAAIVLSLLGMDAPQWWKSVHRDQLGVRIVDPAAAEPAAASSLRAIIASFADPLFTFVEETGLLGALRAEIAPDALLLLLDDPIFLIRQIAAIGLAMRGKQYPVAAVEQQIIAGKTSYQALVNALPMLELLDGHQQALALVAALSRWNPSVREAAVQYLGFAPDAASEQMLLDVLRDEDGALGYAALLALKRRRVVIAGDLLLPLLERPDRADTFLAALRTLREQGDALDLVSICATVSELDVAPEVVKELVGMVAARRGENMRDAISYLTAQVMRLDDWSARTQFARAYLSQALSDEERQDVLSSLDDEGNSEEKTLVIQLLGLLPDDEAYRKLVEIWQQQHDPQLRASALVALHTRGADDLPELLIAAMHDDEPLLRQTVMALLPQQPIAEGLPLLKQGLKDADAAVRVTAARSLPAFASALGGDLIATLLQDAETRIRVAALEAAPLITTPIAADILRSHLNDSNPLARVAALDALAQRGDPADYEHCVLALLDSSAEVQAAAARNLRSYRSLAKPADLVNLLAASDARARAACAETLAALFPERLEDAIDDARHVFAGEGPRDILRPLADGEKAHIIGDMIYLSPSLLQDLASLLESPHWEVRMSAAQALEKIHDHIPDAAIARLRELQTSDPSLAVRNAADDAIFAILPGGTEPES